MKKLLVAICYFVLGPSIFAAEVLIVADEFPAMEFLAAKFKTEENLTSQIVAQTNLPAKLAPFQAVVVYIHLGLRESAEQAFIEYTRAGGKLVVLHHSISSGKRKNKDWFKFLGVDLRPGDVSQGGYKWIEGVTLEMVSLAPAHFITTNRVKYPEQFAWTPAPAGGAAGNRPGFTLHDSEVYLNHVLTEPRPLLLGFRYTDAKSGQSYAQTHGGWIRSAGRGTIIYLMPGHSVRDFENPAYGRIVANAVIFRP